MYRMNYDYTKGILEKVSFDPELFAKELKKASDVLLPYEMEKLNNWLIFFKGKTGTQSITYKRLILDR